MRWAGLIISAGILAAIAVSIVAAPSGSSLYI